MTLTVTFTAADLTGVRHQVRRVSGDWGLAGDDLADWEMAINELTTNAVRHGSPSARLELTAAAELVCRISDRGRGFDTARFLGRRTRPTLTENGGIGLWMVERTTRILSLTSGDDGTIVTVAARFEPPVRPAL